MEMTKFVRFLGGEMRHQRWNRRPYVTIYGGRTRNWYPLRNRLSIEDAWPSCKG